MSRNTLIATASVVVAVLLVGLVWLRGQATKPPPTAAPTKEATTSPLLLEGGNAIAVQDQEAAETVIIDLAVLEEGGYVVIHRVTSEGKPGKVIGKTEFLLQGQHEDLEVDLSEEVAAGDELVAMLHGDDGDEKYGFPDEDLPLKDEQGNVIQMKFKIIPAATLPEE